MKLIIAIVRPFTVEKIVNAFENIESFPGMTLIDSEGFGQRFEDISLRCPRSVQTKQTN